MRSTHNRGLELTNDIRLHSQDKNKLSGLHRRFREQTWPLINRFSKKVTGHIIGGRWAVANSRWGVEEKSERDYMEGHPRSLQNQTPNPGILRQKRRKSPCLCYFASELKRVAEIHHIPA